MPGESDITGRLGRIISTFFKEMVVMNVSIGWILFWGNVVRIHYGMGNVWAGTVTAGLFVLPGVALVAWYLSEVFAIDVPASSPTDRLSLS